MEHVVPEQMAEENQRLKRELNEAQKRERLRGLAAKMQIFDVDNAVIEAAGQVQYLNGELVGAEQVLKKFAAAGPNPEGPDAHKARRLFGAGSDAGAANRLANANQDEYRRLKEVARALGII